VALAGCSFSPGRLAARDDGGTTEIDAPDGGNDDAMIDASVTTPDASDAQVITSTERRIRLTFANGTRASNLDGFPVLVKLDSTKIDYPSVGANAVDLRFFDSDDTTALPYEIEKWDTNGTSFVWVRVPRIDASSTTDHIWLHYGDPAATVDAQNPTAVWTDAVAVYHLREDPGPGGISDIKDSSSAARHGTASPALTSSHRVAAMIGDGLELPGTKDGITFTAATLPVYTYMFWVRGTTAAAMASNNKQPFTNGDVNGNFAWEHSQAAFAGAAAQRDATAWASASAGTLAANTWYFIAMSYTGSQLCVSRDGGTQTCTNHGAPLAPTTPMLIGIASSGSTGFAGRMDEVRVLSVARSTDWLNAEHASQRADPGAPFVTFGSAEVVP
jgi:hypothetical protein